MSGVDHHLFAAEDSLQKAHERLLQSVWQGGVQNLFDQLATPRLGRTNTANQ
jgi:hypothetical protein